MKYIELSIEREIEFMIKYNLTSDELFTVKLIFYAQDGHDEFLKTFFSQGSLSYSLYDILLSLQNKGIINKSYKIGKKGDIFNPRDVDFNKIFLKSYVEHSQELGMELFMNYPSIININGREFSLRNITKLYKNIDDMCFAYGKAIKFNRELHNKIMDLLHWGKENHLINYGICEFISSNKWIELEELKDKDFMTQFNTIEMI